MTLMVSRPATAQSNIEASDVSKLQAQLERLQQIRAERLRIQAEYEQSQNTLSNRVAILKDDLSSTRESLRDVNAQIESLEGEKKQYERRLRIVQNWLNQASEQFVPFATRFAERIRNGVPVNQEQRAGVYEKADSLLRKPADHESFGKAVHQILESAGSELTLSKSIELSNTPIMLNAGQQRIHTWRYRMGLASLIFRAEDGSMYGVWSGDSMQPWEFNLTEHHQDQIDILFDVVNEKQPPNLTRVPLKVSPQQKSNTGAGQ